jgi:hypothetical protein
MDDAEVKLHFFLTSALDGVKRVASSRLLHPQIKGPGTH